MKKIISLLIISIFILSSCSNPKDLERIEELENEINNDIFNKKSECSKHYNSIYNELERNFGKIINGFDESGYYQIENPRIYYSSKINSCISVTEIIENINTSVIHKLEIKNILNNEIITGVTCLRTATGEKINGITQYTSEDLQKYTECVKPYREKLKELQN